MVAEWSEVERTERQTYDSIQNRCAMRTVSENRKEEGPWQAKNHGPSVAPTAPSALGVASIAVIRANLAAASQPHGRGAPDGKDHHRCCRFWNRQGRAAAETCSAAWSFYIAKVGSPIAVVGLIGRANAVDFVCRQPSGIREAGAPNSVVRCIDDAVIVVVAREHGWICFRRLDQPVKK